MRTQQLRHQPGERERGSVPYLCAFSIVSFRPHANVIQHLHSCSTDDLTVRHFPSGQHPRMASYWSIRIPLHSNDRALRQSVCNVPVSLPELHQSRFAAQLQWYRVPFSLRRRVPLCLLIHPLRPHQVHRAPLPQLLHQHRVLLRACPEIAAWRHDFGSLIHRLDSEL